VIAAYTGDRLDQLTRIPVTHQGQSLDWNTFTFPATAGVTYRIALDENDSPDRHRLNWYFGDREWNDPAVTLTAPAAGARVSGVVTLRADASDDSGLGRQRLSLGLWADVRRQPRPGNSNCLALVDGLDAHSFGQRLGWLQQDDRYERRAREPDLPWTLSHHLRSAISLPWLVGDLPRQHSCRHR
jgi:hypothetical protein